MVFLAFIRSRNFQRWEKDKQSIAQYIQQFYCTITPISFIPCVYCGSWSWKTIQLNFSIKEFLALPKAIKCQNRIARLNIKIGFFDILHFLDNFLFFEAPKIFAISESLQSYLFYCFFFPWNSMFWFAEIFVLTTSRRILISLGFSNKKTLVEL